MAAGLVLLLLLPLLQLLLRLSTVHGFASYLQCFVDLDETEVVMNHEILSAANTPHRVEIEVRVVDTDGDESTDDWQSTLDYSPDTNTTVAARLRVPPALQDVDVQYVMETTTPGAMFVHPKLCKGRRSHASRYDAQVQLVVDGTSESIELWAGWAKGHEAVCLTPRTVLTQRRRNEEEQEEEEKPPLPLQEL